MYLKHATDRTSQEREEELRKRRFTKKSESNSIFFSFDIQLLYIFFLKIFFPFSLLDIVSQ